MAYLSIDDIADLANNDSSYTPGVERVEPLDKPLGVQDVMGRFPESVYRQGTDTKLYALLQALCGDAGAGGFAKAAHYARYPQETSLIQFTDLDRFYTSHFSFPRLRSEVYSQNPDEFNSAADLDAMQRKDRSYSARFIQYMRGLHLGGTPIGLETVAGAATGLHVDAWEQYNHVFDQFTDDRLGIDSHGYTGSTSEVSLIVRTTDEAGTPLKDVAGDEVIYHSDIGRDASVTSTAPTGTTRDSLIRSLTPYGRYEAITTYTAAGQSNQFQYLRPDLEFNMIDLTSQLRPAGTLVSVITDEQRLVPVPVNHSFASSEMFRVARYVTGSSSVNWPQTNAALGHFIKPDVETEAPSRGGSVDWPTTYLTLGSPVAYTGFALKDATYGTPNFAHPKVLRDTAKSHSMLWKDQPPPIAKYASYHSGPFSGTFYNLFAPLLSGVPQGYDFLPTLATAQSETPIVMIASTR